MSHQQKKTLKRRKKTVATHRRALRQESDSSGSLRSRNGGKCSRHRRAPGASGPCSGSWGVLAGALRTGDDMLLLELRRTVGSEIEEAVNPERGIQTGNSK